jgi:acyl carrier protein
MANLKDTIRRTLEPLALVPIPDDPDASLFDLGVIDSFGLMDAVAQLEEALGVKVPDSDLNPRRFETLAKIERYFASRIPSGG